MVHKLFAGLLACAVLACTSAAQSTEGLDVSQWLDTQGNLDVLQNILGASGFGQLLDGSQGVTVLMPTDDAWSQLATELNTTVQAFYQNSTLVDILLEQHVLTEPLRFEQLTQLASANAQVQTALGESVAFSTGSSSGVAVDQKAALAPAAAGGIDVLVSSSEGGVTAQVLSNVQLANNVFGYVISAVLLPGVEVIEIE